MLLRRRVKFVYCKRLWKTQEKIKFQFIQEPWIYLPVKSLNPQIFYIINIMNFSKFTQEIYFYLLVASLYLIRSKLNSLLHSFISCPNEWFQVELFRRKYNEKLHFRIQLFLLAIVLRCWNPVECIQKIIISFVTVLLDEMNYGVRHKTVQNAEPAVCRCSARKVFKKIC